MTGTFVVERENLKNARWAMRLAGANPVDCLRFAVATKRPDSSAATNTPISNPCP
jgi:hypothetical protein